MCNKNIAWKKHRFNRKTDLNFIILHYMEEMNADRIETPILAFFLSEEDQKVRNHPARE